MSIFTELSTPREPIPDAIEKHAVHDQSTHGNWARGKTSEVAPGITSHGVDDVVRRFWDSTTQSHTVLNGKLARYTIDGHRVAVRRWEGGSTDLTKFHINLIRSVPDATWEKTRNPLITFTDTDYMMTSLSPSKTENHNTAAGMYFAGDIIDTKGWTLLEQDQVGGVSENMLWIHESAEHTPRTMQHNLMHELGHSIWFHDVHGKDIARNIDQSLDHLVDSNSPSDPFPDEDQTLADARVDDIWAYPRRTFPQPGEAFAELHAYMMFKDTGPQARVHAKIAAAKKHPVFEPIDMWDWFNDYYNGEVPKVKDVIVEKKIQPVGFQGECGTSDLIAQIESTPKKSKLKKLLKHYGPGTHPSGSSQDDHGGTAGKGRSKTVSRSKGKTLIDHGAFTVSVSRHGGHSVKEQRANRRKRKKVRDKIRDKLPTMGKKRSKRS